MYSDSEQFWFQHVFPALQLYNKTESVVFMKAIRFGLRRKFIYYKVACQAATIDLNFYDVNIKQNEGMPRLMLTINLHNWQMIQYVQVLWHKDEANVRQSHFEFDWKIVKDFWRAPGVWGRKVN